MGLFDKGGGGDGGASAARQQENQRQNAIRSGTASVNDIFDNQFSPEFYTGRRQSYLDYAKPQLDDQFADARKQLTYWLDRNGTTNSVARTTKEAELQKLYDTNSRSVNDQALNYENKLRGSVEDARGNLISMLSSSGDVAGTVNNATTRAAALSAPEAYDPIGQMFTTFTNTLGTQAGLERNAALTGGAIQPRYNMGLYSNPGAVKVYGSNV